MALIIVPGGPGPTHRYPQGKLNDDDQGELITLIDHDPDQGVVVLEFGKPVPWLAMSPADARNLAAGLVLHAQALEGDRHGG